MAGARHVWPVRKQRVSAIYHSSENMTADTYPELANLIGAWFHQDYDIEGDSVAEVLASFRAVTPPEQLAALRNEISRFLADHAHDVAGGFAAIFKPDISPSAFSGTTQAFLEEIRDLVTVS